MPSVAAICSTAGFPQPIDGAESAQEQILAVLTYARAIVQNAFADALLHQKLMVSIGEPVGFVSNALEQTQRAGVRRQARAAGPVLAGKFLRYSFARPMMGNSCNPRRWSSRHADESCPFPPSTMIKSGRRTANNFGLRIADCGLP